MTKVSLHAHLNLTPVQKNQIWTEFGDFNRKAPETKPEVISVDCRNKVQ